MSKEITQYEAAGLDEKMRYVQTLSSAGELIPRGLHAAGKPSPGKVLLVCETGAMLGIHPMAAIAGINVIEGRATISPALMSGLIRKAGHKLRVSTAGTVEGGDFVATARLTRSDDPDFTYEVSWTPARAARAGLCKYEQQQGKWAVNARSKSGSALPWESYTEALCKARAIGEVAREGAEDCLMGVQYTPEEMGALVSEGGEMVATVDKPEPTEDWAALVAAVTTLAELKEIRDRANAADEYAANRALFLARSGEISRGEETAPAEAAPDENIVDAEVVDDEPATEETEAERYERESAAEFEAQATDG
ncbi:MULTISPECIES: hypothetical protein [Cryobacterium]|uniref:Recombinase RecT n=1 Tax=Cryobacterium breve TaxID=1259258 RepID=A0ABY2J7C8_9MICO|nr:MULTISPECIES: hypothetical protein [Cryobacterium]TFC92070.1 hypothetical protein E3T20_12205 [Cryobacterium sp. TmT3-12]TFC99791.1 hypothetical protein E3O65_05300 [Cryobacterium breve]